MENVLFFVQGDFNAILFFQEFQETKGQSQTVSQIASQGQNMVTVAYTQRYVELIRLVNKQRDTINSQQADLTKVTI